MTGIGAAPNREHLVPQPPAGNDQENTMAVSRTVPEDAPVQRRRTRWSVTVGPGMIVGVVATVALVVSMFMSWQSGGVHPSAIPAAFLWDRNATGDPSLLVFLIPLAVVLDVGSLVRGGSGLGVLTGLLTMIVVGVYAYQLHEVTDALGVNFSDTLDSGFYVAAIAGVVGFMSGFVPTTIVTRRVDRVDRVDRADTVV
jgi:hypothetical protein